MLLHRPFGTLDKYLLKEMVAPFIVSVLAFVVLLVGRVIFDNLEFIIDRRVPLPLVLRLIAFDLPRIIGLVLPLAVLFGTALSINRLGRDNEITAMRIAGTPLRRIFLPVIAVGFVASLVTFWLNESITPWANRESRRTVRYILGLQSVPPIQDNVFFESEGYYFYVQRVEQRGRDRVELAKVMIYETPPPGGYPMLITAERASNKKNLWTLHDGVLRKIGPDGLTRYEARFQRMELNLKRAIQALWQTQQTPDEMGFRELSHRIEVFSNAGRDVCKLKVDWHFKFSLPLSCLVFALCAAPLSLRFVALGTYSGILLGIVIMFLYWNNIFLGKALGMGGIVPPFVAGWSQCLIFGLAGIYLIWREE